MNTVSEDRLADFTTDRRVLLLSAMALVVGAVSAGVAYVLVKLIALITNISFFFRATAAPSTPQQAHLGLWVVVVPVIGGLIIGLMARYGSSKIRGHGIPEALEAILIGRSQIEPKVALLKPLSSAISIGTGGPFGAEGPIIMTGGALGSLMAQYFHLSSAERKTLLVAGAAGNRSLMLDPDAGRFTCSYDALNRVSTVKDPDGNLTTFQYDAAGRRTTLVDANGNTRKYSYDAADRLTTQIENNSLGNPIITMVDTYDSVGNRTKRIKDGVAATWTYDSGYRLTGQQKSGERATFSYDNAGNTLVKWHEGASPMSFSYDAANRITTMLQGATTTTYTYDANGNLTEENAASVRTTYAYDKENRLTVQQSAGGIRSTYTYDGDGLRRSAIEPAGTLVTFIWDGDDYLMEKS